MEIISRKEAKELGMQFYFTGVPCKRGHMEERYVSNYGCKKCVEQVGKEYYESNKDEVLTRHRNHYCENKDSILERNRQYYHDTKDLQKDRASAYYEENKDVILTKQRKRRENNPENYSEINRRSYAKHRDKYREKSKQYYLENKERLIALGTERRRLNKDAYNAWQREYLKRPDVKAATAIRSCLYRTLNGDVKDGQSYDLVGYTPEELRKHIESLFEDGMGWENHGEWHIDHIIPVAYFIENGENNPAVVNSLSNLRPLWASENLSKGAKVSDAELDILENLYT